MLRGWNVALRLVFHARPSWQTHKMGFDAAGTLEVPNDNRLRRTYLGAPVQELGVPPLPLTMRPQWGQAAQLRHGLQVVQAGKRWTFGADSTLLRLISEARRVRLAHLSDPHLAVHTLQVDPLPHQLHIHPTTSADVPDDRHAPRSSRD